MYAQHVPSTPAASLLSISLITSLCTVVVLVMMGGHLAGDGLACSDTDVTVGHAAFTFFQLLSLACNLPSCAAWPASKQPVTAVYS